MLGETALHVATHTDAKNAVKLLVLHGADVNAVDKKGTTPLMIASMRGSCEIVKLLISAGGSVNMRNGHGKG